MADFMTSHILKKKFHSMLKINSFHFGYRFIVYVRVVAVRCGTLLQPLLVIDLSASNSIGRAVVVLPLNDKKEQKNMGMFMSNK
jgi:hypothetical protein